MTEPHSGICELCHQQIIDADFHGTPVRLDATPVSDGDYRAFLGRNGWQARAAENDDDFYGMRRREHTCPDVQLEL